MTVTSSTIGDSIELRARQVPSLASRWRFRVTRFAAAEPIGFVALLFSIFIFIVAAVPDLFAPHDALKVEMGKSMLGPLSPGHPLGTDQLGRDLLSRVIVGTRVSIAMAVIPVAAAGTLGMLVGMIAGWYRGTTDTILMRTADVFLCIPGLVLALVIVAMLGPSIPTMIVALAIPSIPDFARMVRQQVILVSSTQYVETSRSIGGSTPWILSRHVFPNVLPVLMVVATLRLSSMVFAATALSFLGVGIPLPHPDWGNITADGAKMVATSPWQATLGGFVIFTCMLAFTLAGEALRESSDPLVGRGRSMRMKDN